MSIKTTILIALSLFGLIPILSSQQRKERLPVAASRIVKDKPTVYLSLVRAGVREPLYDNESNEGVWLKLNNNTRWTIVFSAGGVTSSELGDLIMFYEVEAASSRKEGLPNTLPIGYEATHSSTRIDLGPGRSVVFSLPREHLAKNLKIRVNFNYAWEASDRGWVRDNEPKHYVYFYGADIPEKAK